MKLIVAFNNEAGELDSEVVATPEEAMLAALSMIEQAGSLHAGDSITVREVE